LLVGLTWNEEQQEIYYNYDNYLDLSIFSFVLPFTFDIEVKDMFPRKDISQNVVDVGIFHFSRSFPVQTVPMKFEKNHFTWFTNPHSKAVSIKN
jgi:hypothetical protein